MDQCGDRELRRRQAVRVRPLDLQLYAGDLWRRPNTNTAWAVINHEGDFAVSSFAVGNFSLSTLVSRKAGPANARVWAIKLFNGPIAVNDVKIVSLSLVQTGGAACTPAITSPTRFPWESVIRPGRFGHRLHKDRFLGLRSRGEVDGGHRLQRQ